MLAAGLGGAFGSSLGLKLCGLTIHRHTLVRNLNANNLQSHWVCLGATVTIVLLGFEPLLQAVISYSGQMDPSTNSSSIQLGRSEVLDVGLYSSSGSSGLSAILVPPSNMTVMLETYASFPDIGMQSAFSNGLYNSTKALSQSASFVCPTANCTWPTFTSMAVCSACNDVTTHLQRRKEYGTNLGTLTQSGILETCDFTTYYLPRLDLTNPSNSTVTEDNALYYLLAYMSATRITDSRLTLSFQHLNTMITAVEVLKACSRV